eukprot:COSAG05_NODE_560_length_8675_cov_18.684235_11_plen_66_part_01
MPGRTSAKIFDRRGQGLLQHHGGAVRGRAELAAPRGRPAPETMYSTATTYSHTCMANNTAVDLQYS